MKLTAQVKLLATSEQGAALLETLETANAACNAVSEWAWANQSFKQYDLHKGTYHDIRKAFPLSAQVVVRCIAKVADTYKLDKRTPHVFRSTGSIAFDDRILSWKVDRSEVSIWTTAGRMKIPFVCGDRQRMLLQTRQGESDLCLVDGTFYLLATCNVEDPEPLDVSNGFLGVDLGITVIASDSEGNQYSGEPVKAVRRRMKRLRSGLQHTAKKHHSKSAYRHLKKVSRRQSRFVTWVNHNISKEIVQRAIDSRKAIALEDLKGIRERASAFSREMRWLMGNWSFAQLRLFVEYKARLAGIPVVTVDPRNTSRTCAVCGYCDKLNRKTQSHFECLECGRIANADLNAALNIATRAAL